MSGKFQFSPSEDAKLIEHVAKHPAVYDSANKDHKDQSIRDNIWKVIALEVERNVADCKKRWRNIRDTYMKHRKTGPTGSAAKGKSKWPLLQNLEFLNRVSYERISRSNVCSDESQHSSCENYELELNEATQDQDVETFTTPEATLSTSRPSTSTTSTEEVSLENTKKRKTSFLHVTSKKRSDYEGRLLETLHVRSAERQHIMMDLNTRKSEDSDPAVTFFRSMAMTVRSFQPELIIEAKSRICNIVSELELRSLREIQPLPNPVCQPELPVSSPGTSYSEAASDVGSYYSNFSDLSMQPTNELIDLQ